MSHGGIVSTGEHGRGFRRMYGMLERHPDSRPGSASRAAAHGVDHHEDGAVSRCEKAIDIGRRPRFFDSVLSEIRPHGGDKVLRVCHDSILPADPPTGNLFDSESAF